MFARIVHHVECACGFASNIHGEKHAVLIIDSVYEDRISKSTQFNHYNNDEIIMMIVILMMLGLGLGLG